jgi:hypothetical protein
MPRFLNTEGMSTIAIAVCDRCKMKRPLAVMSSDPNFPGLRVCDRGCKDQFDPYRLPARQTERINLRFPRPDLPLTDLTTPSYPYGGYVDGYVADPGFGD